MARGHGVTKAERAAIYFGRSNVAGMASVSLGRYQHAFISRTSLWLYDEEIRNTGFVVTLTEKKRQDLLDALASEAW